MKKECMTTKAPSRFRALPKETQIRVVREIGKEMIHDHLVYQILMLPICSKSRQKMWSAIETGRLPISDLSQLSDYSAAELYDVGIRAVKKVRKIFPYNYKRKRHL